MRQIKVVEDYEGMWIFECEVCGNTNESLTKPIVAEVMCVYCGEDYEVNE